MLGVEIEQHQPPRPDARALHFELRLLPCSELRQERIELLPRRDLAPVHARLDLHDMRAERPAAREWLRVGVWVARLLLGFGVPRTTAILQRLAELLMVSSTERILLKQGAGRG